MLVLLYEYVVFAQLAPPPMHVIGKIPQPPSIELSHARNCTKVLYPQVALHL